MRFALLLCGLLCLPFAVACHASTSGPPSPPAPRPRVGVVTRAGARLSVTVEVADTDETRARGLMFRRSLGPDEGMLFVFPTEARQSFWMRNTLIPLDMMFIASDGTIAGIVHDAQPQTDAPRRVDALSRYVLEVNGGWCALHGVAAGDRVELGEALAR